MNQARFPEFVPGSSWNSWRERLEFLFEANNVQDAAKKRALLFTFCGEQTYDKVRDLLHPLTPAQVPYDDIIERLSSHFETGPSELLGRWRFHKRDQLPQETISEYVDALRALAKDCNFGNVAVPLPLPLAPTTRSPPTAHGDSPATQTATMASAIASPSQATVSQAPTTAVPASAKTILPLEVMLRDRFICGPRDVHLQQRLLSERNITFQMAGDTAKAMESTVSQQASMRSREENKVLQTSATRSPKKNKLPKPSKKCYRCDGAHNQKSCPHRNSTCQFYKKLGHIEKACITKKKKQASGTRSSGRQQANNLTADEADSRNSLFTVNSMSQSTESLTVWVTVNERPCCFEVDSGASFSIMSENTFNQQWDSNRPRLLKAALKLRTWTGTPLQVRGKARVTVQLHRKQAKLDLYIVAGTGTSLLGRDWFEPLGISLSGIHRVTESRCQPLLDQFGTLFNGKISGHVGDPIHIELQPNAVPRFLKSRTVPLALRTAVDKELDKLKEQGILKPVSSSTWATPLVTVRKQNGTLRLCGDYRSTVNQAVAKAAYPLPTVDDMLALVQGGRIFSKIDLQQAYQQLRVDDASSELLTKYMDSLLAGLEGVGAYLDDILISGSTLDEHNKRLRSVLKRLTDAGLKVRLEKCLFRVQELEYLGYHISAAGIRPTQVKVKAILQAPNPRNKKELQSFLGLLSFYNRFLKDRASVAEPLYRLLHKDTPWFWGSQEQDAIDKLKQLLAAAPVLAHFDVNRPVLLACDASPYGIGAVLSQRTQNHLDVPVAFASRTLSKAEQNYAQLDKEGLVVVFGMKHFHHFVAGRHITVVTDHKPLLGIFSQEKQIPAVLSPRMLRWCLLLSAYDYTLIYRPAHRHQNADALSRLPLPTTANEDTTGDILMLESVECEPLTPRHIASLTKEDPILSKVFQAVQTGDFSSWREQAFTPYRRRTSELSTCKGCVIWGSRVILPKKAQSLALRMLHANHPGIAAMKSTARSHFWWPKLYHDIEITVKSCPMCQTWARASSPLVDIEFERPHTPWHTLHMDFAGPIDGWSYLIVIDSFSKWLEVKRMRSSTHNRTVTQHFCDVGHP
ncbi:uncharacterized protein K02A2.6-like [Ornithodoros turicata]|uniref:uncharacterized protein K02A2.6-like n=1 Tax=Ornithodoros turicata TaxID=34597 RepID=UPI00313910AA